MHQCDASFLLAPPPLHQLGADYWHCSTLACPILWRLAPLAHHEQHDAQRSIALTCINAHL